MVAAEACGHGRVAGISTRKESEPPSATCVAIKGHADDSAVRALVLGGRGFIGRALCARLRADGWMVWVRDLPEHDLARGNCWWDTIETGWDVVYLLAATLGVDTVTSDPARVLRTNLRIVQNVLDWLPNRGETLVFASTSEVYAASVARGLAPVPTPEGVELLADPVSPRGAYALSKIVGESMVRHGHGRSVIVRFHNVYGPGQSRGFVIPELIHGAPVHNPSATRAFCYIDDAVEGTILAAQHPGEVFNVGNDEEVRIGDLAHMIQGDTISLVVSGARQGDPLRRCPDLTKLRALGYAPKVSLVAGLARTRAWWRTRG